MPVLNFRFALKVFVVLALMAGVLAGVHTFQAERIPAALKRQAERAEAAGKQDAAIRYLRQYLEFQPKDIAVRVELADKLAAKGVHPQELYQAYERILRVDGQHTATRRAAVGTCLRLGRFSDAVEHAEKFLASTPKDTEIWLDLARANAALARTDAAVAAYEGAISNAPTSAPAYLKYISYLMGDANRPDDAKAVVDRCVKALPDQPEPYLARARWALSKPEAPVTPAVLADVDKTLALAPNHADALLLKADCLQRMRDIAGARECLSTGMKTHPKDGRFPRRLAWVEVHRGNYSKAIAVLDDGLKTGTQNTDDLLIPLGDLLVQMGETERAETIAKRMESKRTPLGQLQAKYIRARMLMRQQDYPAAISALTAIRTEGATFPGMETQANLLMSVCYRATADREKERECLKLILDRDPRHNAARVALAQSYLNAGQFADAGREYEEAARSPFCSPQTVAMAIRLRATRLRANSPPEDWAALDRAALVLQAKAGPGVATPLRADLARYRGQTATALAILRQDVVKHPGDTGLWMELITTTAQHSGMAAAFQTYDEALALAGDQTELKNFRAQLGAMDPLRLRPLESAARTVVDTWSESEREQYWLAVVEAADTAGESALLAEAYAKLAVMKSDPTLWFLAYEAALEPTQQPLLQRAETALFTLGDKATVWRDLCSGLNPKTPNRDEWISKISKYSYLPEACRVLARATSGAASTAWLERAVQLDPTGLMSMKALLIAYAKNGDEIKLSHWVKRLGQDPRWMGAPLKRVLLSAIRSTDGPVVERLLSQAATVAPPGTEDVVWLGDCNRAAKSPEKARAWYTQAVAQTQNPDVWLRLLEVSPDKAKVMDLAAVTLSPTAHAAFSAAVWATDESIFAMCKTPEDRLNLVQARVAMELSRLNRVQAITVLDRFLRVPELRKTDTAWANRALGLMLADGGTADERKRAFAILVSGDAAGTTATDQRTTAAVVAGLSRYLDGAERTTALTFASRLLENVIEAEKNPRDQFLLYQVLKALGTEQATTRARDILQTLLKTYPTTEYSLAALEEDPTRAAALLPSLMPLEHTDSRVSMALVRMDFRTGQVDSALARIQNYLRNETMASEANSRATRVVTVLENVLKKESLTADGTIKVTEAAVGIYESMVHIHAEAVPAAALLLARIQRVTDAFEFVQKHGQTLPLRLKAAAGVAIARTAKLTPAQDLKVQGWVDAALNQEPNSTAVRLTNAEWLAAKGETEKAEAEYLSLLKREPNNPHALNNLAWLLAPYPERSAQALEYIERAARELGYTPELLDTRARIRITARQADLAVVDATQALTREKTPLRYFHLALAKQGMTPPRPEEARAAFQNAKKSGLAPHMVHPADLPALRSFDAGQ